MDSVQVFDKLKNSLDNNITYSSENMILYKGDSLDILKRIPDHSVSLILTDPPYHTTKKKNITGDTAFEKDEDFLDWMKAYSVEWKRVLKPNGSLFVFCSPAMTARLECTFMEDFNILSQIVWTKPNAPGFDGWKQKVKKESLRQWYSHSERIIFMAPSYPGNLFNSYFGNLLREWRKTAKLTSKELTEYTGAYGKVNNGGAVSNWEAGRNVPSREQYQKIIEALYNTGKFEYLPSYEDVIRPFNVDRNVEFTDIWNFENVRPYKGKHPAEKPLDLLEHAIKATTYEKDIVLDCFAGSGSTLKAATNLNRLAIGIEIEDEWCNKIKDDFQIEQLTLLNN